ncbi:MAG: threo-3-hydroxy-L-aspartate ammonia-lyase [Phycisphaerales bacterium JB054]
MNEREGLPPDMSLVGSVTIDDVRAAAARLEGVARRTPVMTSRGLDASVGASVFVKCENLQRVGAFKFRGAYNALARLVEAAGGGRTGGVLTYSSGNHAQAVALAASIVGVPAVIVMPDNAPRVKLEATRAYLSRAPEGSEVVVYDHATTVREELGGQIAAERGLTVVPPYDHPDVIAGQGTVALELLEEVGELDWLFVCCGGGGVLSGCAVVGKAVRPGCRVVGVEPEAGDDVTRSFRDGVLRSVRNPDTVADGARTPYAGRYTFPLICAHVDEMVTVSDGELLGAMGFLMERLRVVVEPTGALATAGAMRLSREGRAGLAGSRVGVVITGGNVDLAAVSGLLSR